MIKQIHPYTLRWHAHLQVLYLEIDEITGDCTLESRWPCVTQEINLNFMGIELKQTHVSTENQKVYKNLGNKTNLLP